MLLTLLLALLLPTLSLGAALTRFDTGNPADVAPSTVRCFIWPAAAATSTRPTGSDRSSPWLQRLRHEGRRGRPARLGRRRLQRLPAGHARRRLGDDVRDHRSFDANAADVVAAVRKAEVHLFRRRRPVQLRPPTSRTRRSRPWSGRSTPAAAPSAALAPAWRSRASSSTTAAPTSSASRTGPGRSVQSRGQLHDISSTGVSWSGSSPICTSRNATAWAA